MKFEKEETVVGAIVGTFTKDIWNTELGDNGEMLNSVGPSSKPIFSLNFYFS